MTDLHDPLTLPCGYLGHPWVDTVVYIYDYTIDYGQGVGPHPGSAGCPGA